MPGLLLDHRFPVAKYMRKRAESTPDVENKELTETLIATEEDEGPSKFDLFWEAVKPFKCFEGVLKPTHNLWIVAQCLRRVALVAVFALDQSPYVLVRSRVPRCWLRCLECSGVRGDVWRTARARRSV